MRVASPERFARNLQRRARQAENSGSRAIRTAGLAVLSGVVLSTPVDTGRARSNWLVGLNSPRRQTQPSSGTSGTAAIVQGGQVLAAVRPGGTVFISNNLPYIVSLNRGSSPQASAGYVGEVVNQVARDLDVRIFVD